jgi:hypothetical protein
VRMRLYKEVCVYRLRTANASIGVPSAVINPRSTANRYLRLCSRSQSSGEIEIRLTLSSISALTKVANVREAPFACVARYTDLDQHFGLLYHGERFPVRIVESSRLTSATAKDDTARTVCDDSWASFRADLPQREVNKRFFDICVQPSHFVLGTRIDASSDWREL